MKTHSLKTWPEPFSALLRGEKPYELRKNDRNYQVGDVLFLREWDPATESYTSRMVFRAVCGITRGGQLGLSKDYCILGLRDATHAEKSRSIAELHLEGVL